MTKFLPARMAVLAILPTLLGTSHAMADSPPPPPPAAAAYADLADLADGAPLVAKVQVRKLVSVEPERAGNVRAGRERFYIEARTEALYAGRSPIGEALRYLVDLPLGPKGKPPTLKKQSVIIFARAVPGHPGELQLVAPDAQLAWNQPSEERLKGILGELYSAGAPQRVNGVREAIHVSGDLAGEGETQVFLATANGEPAAISIGRNPGQPVRISVSFSEVLGEATGAPKVNTLAWYRLACFLPPAMPQTANLAGSAADRAAAAADYRYFLDQLGSCPRERK